MFENSSAVVSERIYNQRHRLGYTQGEVANRVGVSRATVSAIENGKIDSTSFGTIMRILTVLDMRFSVDYGFIASDEIPTDDIVMSYLNEVYNNAL